MLRFHDEGHKYTSVVPDARKWVSVTTLVSSCKEKFNDNIAHKNSQDPSSKWYGIPASEIKQIWKNEATRSTDLGTWYHKKKEIEDIQKGAIICVEDKGWKYALSQQLLSGVYPEFITYHPEYNICGQVDRLEIKEDTFCIDDYKSNKKIDTEGFRGKKMLAPVEHLDDCNLNHYALQLSIYAYMVKYHNPWLQVDKLTIRHVKFEIESLDKYGYPITKQHENGDYVVESVTPIIVPYLEKEVISILQKYQNSSH